MLSPWGRLLAATCSIKRQRLAGTEAGRGGAENGRRRIEIVASDQLGTLDPLDFEPWPMGHHLSPLIARRKGW